MLHLETSQASNAIHLFRRGWYSVLLAIFGLVLSAFVTHVVVITFKRHCVVCRPGGASPIGLTALLTTQLGSEPPATINGYTMAMLIKEESS